MNFKNFLLILWKSSYLFIIQSKESVAQVTQNSGFFRIEQVVNGHRSVKHFGLK